MTQRTTEEKIRAVDEQLMLLFIGDPKVDWNLLKDLTGGIVTEDAAPGNGLEIAKSFARYNRRLLTADPTPARRKPGRKPKVKATEANASTGATQPAKKRRGRPPKNATPVTQPAPAPETKPAE
jgi:hypothetical protein